MSEESPRLIEGAEADVPKKTNSNKALHFQFLTAVFTDVGKLPENTQRGQAQFKTLGSSDWQLAIRAFRLFDE